MESRIAPSVEVVNLGVRRTALLNRCVFFKRAASLLTGLVLSGLMSANVYADAKTPIGITLEEDSDCHAQHYIFGVSENDHQRYPFSTLSPSADDDPTDAEIYKVPGAGSFVSDPDASASGDGYSRATIDTFNDPNPYFWAYRTQARAAIDDKADADPGAYAFIESDYFASTDATFEVGEFDDPDVPAWIEGKISWQGFGEEHDSGPVDWFSYTAGWVYVGDSQLGFETIDGVTHVEGTLMDLDGPHYVSEDIPGSVASYTYRQWVDQGSEVNTSSSIGGYAWIDTVQPGEGGLVGETIAKSTIRPFVGTPD